VQVNVGEQRRDHRALPRPPLTDRHDSIFQDARLQPFLDQADDASVADTMFQEPDQPSLADFVEERSDVDGSA
jgi:site-specific DNA recombinase